MSGYERPTERGQSARRVTFWATIWTPDKWGRHGQALVSPAFGTEPELVGWVRAHRCEDAQVAAWKRTATGSDFHDERLSTREEPVADTRRLAEMLTAMRDLLKDEKRKSRSAA